MPSYDVTRRAAEMRARRAALRLRGVRGRATDDERLAEAVADAQHTAMVEAGRAAGYERSTPSRSVVDSAELAALRAAVARLEGENATLRGAFERNERARDILRDGVDHLSESLVAATAERDAARAALDGLLADVEHFAIIQHRALHGPPGVRDPDRPPSAAWRDCRRDGCPGLRRAVARARAATGHGGAG